MEALNEKIINTSMPSLKDYVVISLSNNAPMNGKQIHQLITTKFGKNISSQGTYKLLSDLSRKGIITKQEKNYFLNKDWIENTKKFLEHVEIKPPQREAKTIIMENNSFHGWGREMLQILVRDLDNGIVTEPYSFQRHIWWILALEKDEFEWFKKLGAIPFTVICRENTVFDQAMANLYQQVGHKVTLGAGFESHCDMLIYGDWVHQIYMPDKLKKILDEECSKLTDVSQLFSQHLKDIMYDDEIKVKTVMLQDKELADKLRKELEVFSTQK